MCEDLTGELRRRLDALGVEWQDWSDDYPVLNGNGDQLMRIHIERTRFEGIGGETAAALLGWMETAEEGRQWITYGAPYMLECWFKPYSADPVPMDVGMVLRVALGA